MRVEKSEKREFGLVEAKVDGIAEEKEKASVRKREVILQWMNEYEHTQRGDAI